MDDSQFVEMLLKKRHLYKETLKHPNNTIKDLKYKNYKNVIEKSKRYMKLEYYRTKCIEFKSNTKKLWGMIKKITGKVNDKSTVISCIKVDTIEHYDATGITNTLGKYFSSVGEAYANKITKSSIPINNYISKTPQNQNSMLLQPLIKLN